MEFSGIVGRALDWGSLEGLLVQDSPSVEPMCCALEHDTLFAA